MDNKQQESVLKVTNLCKTFGKTEILHNIDFEMRQGEVYGLVGKNGAGKTTLMRLICGLMKPSNGSISITSGEKLIGYMPQSCRFDDGMTVKDTIRLFAKLKGDEKLDPAKWVERLQLDVNKKVKHLSPGQQKKLQLVLAMIGNPELYVLDEPTAGLDPSATHEMKAMIREIRESGKSILISSHILQDMDEICTNIAIMENGQLTYDNELSDWYIFKTSPIPGQFYNEIAQSFTLGSNESRTNSLADSCSLSEMKMDENATNYTDLTVQITKEQVPIMIQNMVNHGILIYEATPTKVNNLVMNRMHLDHTEEGAKAV